MYRICKTIDIESGHMLSKHPGKCKYPHGHTRKIEFVLEANELDENDMVCDFGVIRGAIDQFLDTYDHGFCMNTSDPRYDAMKDLFRSVIIDFHDTEPTTEAMAKVMFDTIQSRIKSYRTWKNSTYTVKEGVRVVSVKVWETNSSWAEYCG